MLGGFKAVKSGRSERFYRQNLDSFISSDKQAFSAGSRAELFMSPSPTLQTAYLTAFDAIRSAPLPSPHKYQS